jgi:hypothetical protein
MIAQTHGDTNISERRKGVGLQNIEATLSLVRVQGHGEIGIRVGFSALYEARRETQEALGPAHAASATTSRQAGSSGPHGPPFFAGKCYSGQRKRGAQPRKEAKRS